MRLLIAIIFRLALPAASQWRQWVFPALAATMVFSLAPIKAEARVAVSGAADALQLDAEDSSLAEVLTALNAAFGLRYRTSIALNQPVTGTFKGPLPDVLSHLLQNYDFVVKSIRNDQIEVSVLKFAGKDAEKVISTLITSYPDPMWRARSYSRAIPPIPARRRSQPQ